MGHEGVGSLRVMVLGVRKGGVMSPSIKFQPKTIQAIRDQKLKESDGLYR